MAEGIGEPSSEMKRLLKRMATDASSEKIEQMESGECGKRDFSSALRIISRQRLL